MRKKNQTASLVNMMLLIAASLIVLWGLENESIVIWLYKDPQYILPFLLTEYGVIKVFLGFISLIFLFWIAVLKSGSHNNVLRGARIISSSQLKARLKKGRNFEKQLQLKIGGVSIPSEYENQGFFMIGSPGSGKTQAISQMLHVLKRRNDFRGLIFDRGGEMLEKFYNPKMDLILNPFDARSVHWSHIHEPTRFKTIAAGLIPLPSSGDDFFAQAARVVLAELFQQTKNNAEIYELLQADCSTVGSFLKGTLAGRYLENSKIGTSVLSTVTNYCEFYSALTQPHNKALSFYHWASSNSPRWIFLTLRENDTEILQPLYSLIFELTLRGLLSNLERTRKTAVVIDELGALNRLPSLHRLLSESRKFLGCPILGTQTEAQITKVYSSEDTRIVLQGTKTKLILRCADPQTAETMAHGIGKQQLVHTLENRSRNFGGKNGSGRSISQNEQIREDYVVMPDELKILPNLEGYLKFADLPAAKIKVKHKKFPRHTKQFVSRRKKTSAKETIIQSWRKLFVRLKSRN